MSEPDDVEESLAYVLDASAVLAQLHEETGANLVETVASQSVISSVNWAEVLQKVIDQGSKQTADVRRDFLSAGLRISPFTAENAESTAHLWSTTRLAALSLGDRACLSLAHKQGLPAVTTDRA